MKYSHYHAEVVTGDPRDSDTRAIELADQYAGAIKQAGGVLQVGRSYGHSPAVLILMLPEGTDPRGLLPPPLRLYQVHVTTTPAVEDQGITGD